MFIFLFMWLEMFAENDGPIFWKKGLNKFQLILVICDWGISYEMALRRISLDPQVPWH